MSALCDVRPRGSSSWFAKRGVESVPLREPRKMFTPADTQWLKAHESLLAKEGDGRDSHIELFPQFDQHDTSDLNPDDKDGVDFAETLEAKLHSDETRLQQEDATEGSINLSEPEQTQLPQDIPSKSGALASSWVKVERVLASGLYGKPMTYDEDMKLRARGLMPSIRTRKELGERTRVPTPKFLLHEATKNAWDVQQMAFQAYSFYEFNPHVAALQLVGHKTAHNSPIDFTRHIVVDAEMLPGTPLVYPTGGIREWSGDRNDPAFKLWLDTGHSRTWMLLRTIWQQQRAARRVLLITKGSALTPA